MTHKVPFEERLAHFINEVSHRKEIWLLQADSGMFAMLEDDNDQSYLPVWALESEASEAISGDWLHYAPEKMDLREFNQWMHELDEDGILIGVSPDEHGKVLPFKGEDLRKMLEIAARND